MTHDDALLIARRAGQMAGLSEDQAAACALMAVAEWLMDEADKRDQMAQWADTVEYRSRDEREARKLRNIAEKLRGEAHGIDGGI